MTGSPTPTAPDDGDLVESVQAAFKLARQAALSANNTERLQGLSQTETRVLAALEASDNAALRKQIEEKDAALGALRQWFAGYAANSGTDAAAEEIALIDAALAPPSAEQMIDG